MSKFQVTLIGKIAKVQDAELGVLYSRMYALTKPSLSRVDKCTMQYHRARVFMGQTVTFTFFD